MAEETKVELDVNETASFEDAVDEIITEKPEESKTEDGGSQSAEKQKDSKGDGWLTMLPKELRDGIDTTKYSNLAEYVKDLREHQAKEEPKATKEEVDAQWAEYLKEELADAVDDSGKKDIEEMFELLKSQGVEVSQARKTLDAYTKTVTKKAEALKEANDRRLGEYVKTNWGDKSEENFDCARRGLSVIADENVELLKVAKAEGLTKNPAFVEVCRMLGARTSESRISRSGRVSKGDDYDPRNPLKYN